MSFRLMGDYHFNVVTIPYIHSWDGLKAGVRVVGKLDSVPFTLDTYVQLLSCTLFNSKDNILF